MLSKVGLLVAMAQAGNLIVDGEHQWTFTTSDAIISVPRGMYGKAWISSGDVSKAKHPTIFFSGIGYAAGDNCFLSKDAQMGTNWDHASFKAADKTFRGTDAKSCSVGLSSTNRMDLSVTTAYADIINLTTKSTESGYKNTGAGACYSNKYWIGVQHRLFPVTAEITLAQEKATSAASTCTIQKAWFGHDIKETGALMIKSGVAAATMMALTLY